MKSNNIDELFRITIEPLKVKPSHKAWDLLKLHLDLKRPSEKECRRNKKQSRSRKLK